MNVIPSAPVQTVKKELEVNNNDTINLYHENPHYELTLDEFEIYALKRVKVSLGETRKVEFHLLFVLSCEKKNRSSK
jgi:hypothetical protein